MRKVELLPTRDCKAGYGPGSAWDSLFEFCAFSAKIWAHQNANPPADRRFMANSLEIAPTSPNYVRALTDSLKALYPTTLACLIPPSLPSWYWLLRCPHLFEKPFPTDLQSTVLFGVVIRFLFCLPLLIFCCLYIALFLCLFVWRNSALGLRCYANKIISYHIISLFCPFSRKRILKLTGHPEYTLK